MQFIHGIAYKLQIVLVAHSVLRAFGVTGDERHGRFQIVQNTRHRDGSVLQLFGDLGTLLQQMQARVVEVVEQFPLADIAAYFYGLVEILARIYAVYLLQYVFVDYNACHL